MKRLITLLGVIGLFLFLATSPTKVLASPGFCAANTCYYYFSNWEWFETESMDFWAAPFGVALLASIDFRSNPDAGTPGPVANGFGFFVYSETVDICPLGCLHFGVKLEGTDVNGLNGQLRKDALASLLALPDGDIIRANTTINIIWELLILRADSTGETRWKPLQAGPGGDFTLILGGHALVQSDDNLTVFNDSAAATILPADVVFTNLAPQIFSYGAFE